MGPITFMLTKYLKISLLSSLFIAGCDSEVLSNEKYNKLPLIPLHVSDPYPDAEHQFTYTKANKLHSLFKQYHYELKRVQAENHIPPIFVTNLPNDLNKLSVDNKINSFIQLLLPNVIAVNQQIMKVRKVLLQWQYKDLTELTKIEKNWLKELSNNYGMKDININKLLIYIDIIPTGMVLAQGINESGWGTGSFAIKGNAFYGQHLPNRGGKFMLTTNDKVKVAAFDTIYQATAAYAYNINSSLAYQKLRTLRAKLRAENKLLGANLVVALNGYSSRGQAYVDDLKSLIKYNNLDSYHQTTFDSNRVLATVRFTH